MKTGSKRGNSCNLRSGDTSIWGIPNLVPENVHVIFVSVNLLLKGQPVDEEGTILGWFPKPGFNLHSYHTLRGVAQAYA